MDKIEYKYIGIGFFVDGRAILDPIGCYAEPEDDNDTIRGLFEFLINDFLEHDKGDIAAKIHKMLEVGKIYNQGKLVSLDAKIGDMQCEDHQIDDTIISTIKIAVTAPGTKENSIKNIKYDKYSDMWFCVYCGSSMSELHLLCPCCKAKV